jgi:glutathione S-transferase
MLTLYGVYRSRASRPLWLLAECGAPFRHVPVIQAYRLPDAAAPDAPFNTASPAFLKINPQGQVPCMVDGDLVLTESLAITLYIARRYGGDLGPQDEDENALMLNWAFLGASSIEEPALKILQTLSGGNLDALPDTPEGKAIVTKAAASLERYCARVDAHLAGSTWLLGSRFTAADIILAECWRYAQAHPALISGYPALDAWLKACQSRPGFKAMWEKRLAEPA